MNTPDQFQVAYTFKKLTMLVPVAIFVATFVVSRGVRKVRTYKQKSSLKKARKSKDSKAVLTPKLATDYALKELEHALAQSSLYMVPFVGGSKAANDAATVNSGTDADSKAAYASSFHRVRLSLQMWEYLSKFPSQEIESISTQLIDIVNTQEQRNGLKSEGGFLASTKQDFDSGWYQLEDKSVLFASHINGFRFKVYLVDKCSDLEKLSQLPDTLATVLSNKIAFEKELGCKIVSQFECMPSTYTLNSTTSSASISTLIPASTTTSLANNTASRVSGTTRFPTASSWASTHEGSFSQETRHTDESCSETVFTYDSSSSSDMSSGSESISGSSGVYYSDEFSLYTYDDSSSYETYEGETSSDSSDDESSFDKSTIYSLPIGTEPRDDLTGTVYTSNETDSYVN